MTREETLQVAKPILFNTEMVRAILDGRKTVTRRVIKVPETAHLFLGINPETVKAEFLCGEVRNGISADWEIVIKLPYQIGDILYVRETWVKIGDAYLYRADGETFDGQQIKFKPSIHMPKEAARIFLRVTGVRVERLQDITEKQAIAESAEPFMITADIDKPDEEKCWKEMLPALSMFPSLWNGTVKKSDLDKYGWNANPWVFVIEFERVEVQNENTDSV